MKRLFFLLAALVTVILSVSCASERPQQRGGTTDMYGRSTEAGIGRPPASRYPYQHHDGYDGFSYDPNEMYGD